MLFLTVEAAILLHQYHLDRFAELWSRESGDIDAGGDLIPRCISSVPAHNMMPGVQRSTSEGEDLPSHDVVDFQTAINLVGQIKRQLSGRVERIGVV